MAQFFSLFRNTLITIFALSFVFCSCYGDSPKAQPEPKLCNFDDFYKVGSKIFDDIESCNVGLLRNCEIEKIYQLGDSISDVGNLIRETPVGAASPFARLPYGSNFSMGPTGRASNGYLVIDYLAMDVGLPLLPPFKKSDADFSHGINFAVAGSTALSADVLSVFNISSLMTNTSLSVQLDWMSAYLEPKSSNQTDIGDKTKNAVFILGPFGGSDYQYALFQGKSVHEIETTMIPKVVDAIMTAIDKLRTLGARSIVVNGLYTIFDLPIYRTAFKGNPEIMNVTNDIAIKHNIALQQAINKLKQEEKPYPVIAYGDYFSSYRTLENYAVNAGLDSMVCCGSGGGRYNFNLTRMCGEEGVSACAEPQKHISWDGLQLTQEAYRIMSKYILYHLFKDLLCPNP